MRDLNSTEQESVTGAMQEVVVSGRRTAPGDPLRFGFLADIGAFNNASMLAAAEDNGRAEARDVVLEEVIVKAETVLSDHLKVDLGKCGYPLDYLLNPPSQLDSAEIWGKCFEKLSKDDKHNLGEALKELNKVISEKRLVTAVTGNWILHCIEALDADNGGWFGQNFYQAIHSARIGIALGVAMKIITRQ